MKNFVKPGKTLSLIAPYDVLAGQAFKVGSIIAVATTDALAGAAVEGDVEGVFDLAKADSQAWTQGVAVYWDDTGKYFTTSSSGTTKAGVAEQAVANTAGLVIGRVRLNGSF